MQIMQEDGALVIPLVVPIRVGLCPQAEEGMSQAILQYTGCHDVNRNQATLMGDLNC